MIMSPTLDVDALVESAAVVGQIAGGVAPAFVAAHSPLGARAVAVLAGPRLTTKNPAWSAEDENRLRQWLGILSEDEIARRLGRTPVAVHLRWKRDLQLTAPSKRPDVLTAEQIAQGLGIDGHQAADLIHRGILPGRRLPFRGRVARVVDRTQFLMWVVNPRHWCYFKPARVACNPLKTKHRRGRVYDVEFWQYVRRLIDRQRRRWQDEWWTPGEVARARGLGSKRSSTGFVNKAILSGKLPATRWSNWCILKSDAQALPQHELIAYRGIGGKGQDHKHVSEAADAFLVLALAVGCTYAETARMMKVKEKYVMSRLKRLRLLGRIPGLIADHGLRVRWQPATGCVSADYRDYANRFPRLARLMARAGAGERLTRSQTRRVRQVRAKMNAAPLPGRKWKRRVREAQAC